MVKHKLLGAALGTLLGSLAVALYPRRQEILETITDRSEEFTDKAREYADFLLKKAYLREERREANLTWITGLAGLLIGAGAALFLTPKTGRQLRNQVQKKYGELSDKTQDVLDLFKNNSHPFVRSKTLHPVKKARKTLSKARH